MAEVSPSPSALQTNPAGSSPHCPARALPAFAAGPEPEKHRERGNPPDSCRHWDHPTRRKEGASAALPSHHSSSLHPILLFFSGTTQHGFVAHASVFLQAVSRAELFCSTGAFLHIWLRFTVEMAGWGVWVLLQLAAPLMRTAWREESPVPPAAQAAGNGATSSGWPQPVLSMSHPPVKGRRVFRGTVSGVSPPVPSSQPSQLALGVCPPLTPAEQLREPAPLPSTGRGCPCPPPGVPQGLPDPCPPWDWGRGWRCSAPGELQHSPSPAWRVSPREEPFDLFFTHRS